MNIAIIFRSMTGHSKKIARAIAAELNLVAQNIKAKPDLSDIDLLFIVGGIYSGKSLPDTIEYLKTLTSNNIKKAVLLTSSTSDKSGQEEVRQILSANNIEVSPKEYRCRGNFLFMKLGHPNKSEIAKAVSFAKEFLQG